MAETKNHNEDTPTASERETAYLLRSETMRRRLLEAMKRKDGIPFEEVCERLGIYRNEEGRFRGASIQDINIKLQEMNPA